MLTTTRSEVARLMQQIDLEYEAARRALSGMAYGTARHEFINARMENIGRHQQSIIQLVGTQEAARLLYDSARGQHDRQTIANEETRP